MSINVRRIAIDVDWASEGPGIVAIAEAIHEVEGVESCNITVTEIDTETVGSDITVEGTAIDVDALCAAINSSGAVVHSIDQLVTGERVLERVARAR